MKKITFYIVLVVLLVSPIVGLLKLVKEEPLSGAIAGEETKKLDYFTWNRWFDGRFQDKMEKTASQNAGLRNTLIRISNQINFSVFKSTNAEKVVIGKDNILFEEGYILDYLGRNYSGESYIREQSLRIKRIQDTLYKVFGIHLIVVFEPGKASIYPEKIGNEYLPENKTVSNYETYSRIFREQKITHLDINQYFKSIKDSSRYPLYPDYGVHWSSYGMYLATDTLLKFIKHETNYNLALPIWQNIEVTDKLKDVDFDIEKTMNLLFPLAHQNLAYPQIKFDTVGKERPKVLTIADSYYWSLFDNKIPHRVFANSDFWYYNATIYPDIWGDNAKYVKNLNQEEEILKQNVILIMITEMNLYRAFWKFEDVAENVLSIKNSPSTLCQTTHIILNNDAYYKDLINYTNTHFICFDKCLEKISNFVSVSNLNPCNYISKAYLVLENIIQLKNNGEAMKLIQEKAKIKNISISQSIFDDALWCYEEEVKSVNNKLNR